MSREYQIRAGITTTKILRNLPAKTIRTSKVGSWRTAPKANQQNKQRQIRFLRILNWLRKRILLQNKVSPDTCFFLGVFFHEW